MNLPGELQQALDRWMAEQDGSLRQSQQVLQEAYRAGKSSQHVSLSNYVATRVPATFAANQKVLEALARALPGFQPTSMLDLGAGPGTASWAALAQWPDVVEIMQCEPHPTFAALAQRLNRESALAALSGASVQRVAERDLPVSTTADLVMVSYMLAELPMDEMPAIALRVWQRTAKVLLLIEPGTPAGFGRLRKLRDVLLAAGGHVVAPCTHSKACPIQGTDWCHFKTRLQRSRTHMHAKQATLPYEDEAFSYLVMSRLPVDPRGGRVIAPPLQGKAGVDLKLCRDGAVQNLNIARRDKPSYKLAKKVAWGDLWE